MGPDEESAAFRERGNSTYFIATQLVTSSQFDHTCKDTIKAKAYNSQETNLERHWFLLLLLFCISGAVGLDIIQPIHMLFLKLESCFRQNRYQVI